jgi:hypothetical protein
MSKSVNRAVAVFSALLAAGGLAWIFASQIGGPGRTEAAAVILSAPPEFAVTSVGNAATAEAAGRLTGLVSQQPEQRKLGVDFTAPDGSRVFLLIDRDADVLDQRTSGATGTRTQTVWHGRAVDRLERARTTGDLDLPGLPPGEKKNLYH